jgi:hypothetical protein
VDIDARPLAVQGEKHSQTLNAKGAKPAKKD